MTSFAAALPPREQQRIRRTLRDRIDEWLQLSYRHDVLVGRAVRGLQIEATALFDREVVRPLLVKVGGSLSSVQLRTGDLVRDLFPELVGLRAEIERVVHRGSEAIRTVTEQRMGEIARQEVRWVDTAARRVLGDDFGAGMAGRFGDGVPAQAERSVRENTWLGDTTEKWFEKLLDRPTADKARAWVTTGVKQGLSVDEITRGLAGTKTQTGVLDGGRFAAKALVRTAATHAASEARGAAFRELGLTHWRFVATLDHRTSLQCASEDGKVYPVGEGEMPPLHINCRSVAVPAFGPDDEPSGKRASIRGQVPASTTFEEWVETIPKGEQDRYFGKTKAAAWRAGKLTLKDMLGRDMQPLTLAELRELDRL